jgi:hypothetical protein
MPPIGSSLWSDGGGDVFGPKPISVCCYWFEKARHQTETGKCKRAGLLAGIPADPGADVAGSRVGDVTEEITFDLPRRPAAGRYVVTLVTPGLTDRKGNAVVETRYVSFPQTGPPPNPNYPNYVAEFVVNAAGQSSGPRVFIPPSARRAAARYMALLRRNTVLRNPNA